MKKIIFILFTFCFILSDSIEVLAISQYGEHLAIDICKHQNGGSRCVQEMIQRLEVQCRENLKKISRASKKSHEALKGCPTYRKVVSICVESPHSYKRTKDLQSIGNDDKYGTDLLHSGFEGAKTAFDLWVGDPDEGDLRNARLFNGFFREFLGLPPVSPEDVARDIGRKHDFEDWKKKTLSSPGRIFNNTWDDEKDSKDDMNVRVGNSPKKQSFREIDGHDIFPEIIYYTQTNKLD